MEYRVEVSNLCLLQLKAIADYVKDDLQAPEASTKWLASMEEALGSLDQFPRRYPLVEQEPWRSFGYRRMKVGKHIAYYQIKETRKTVIVIAVIASKMDQRKALGKFNAK